MQCIECRQRKATFRRRRRGRHSPKGRIGARADHPLCQRCFNSLMDAVRSRQLKEREQERGYAGHWTHPHRTPV